MTVDLDKLEEIATDLDHKFQYKAANELRALIDLARRAEPSVAADERVRILVWISGMVIQYGEEIKAAALRVASEKHEKRATEILTDIEDKLLEIAALASPAVSQMDGVAVDLEAAEHALDEVGEALAEAGYDNPNESLASSIRALAAERDGLRSAATAVVARWDSVLWRQEVGTNELINRLRAALARAPLPAQGAEQGSIRGPLTDAQRDECRHLYRNLRHGFNAADDVIRAAAVYGYVNGRLDFAAPAQAGDARDEQDMMLWLSDDPEVFANGPDDFANDYAANCLSVGDDVEVDVDCTYRAPKRALRIALIPKGDDDDCEVVWKWVERAAMSASQGTTREAE